MVKVIFFGAILSITILYCISLFALPINSNQVLTNVVVSASRVTPQIGKQIAYVSYFFVSTILCAAIIVMCTVLYECSEASNRVAGFSKRGYCNNRCSSDKSKELHEPEQAQTKQGDSW